MIRRGFQLLQLASNTNRALAGWTAPLGCGSRGVGTKADLNKGDLIKLLRERGNMSEARARETMEAVLQEIKAVVSKGGKATLTGFGTFKWTLRSGRDGVNPKTREKIRYPSKPAPKFIPSKLFKQMLNDKSPAE